MIESAIYATSLKDRLSMLRQALPTWMKQPHKAILVLDWDSPDQEEVAKFVESAQDGTVHLALAKCRPLYEHSRCRNIKTALCSLLVPPEEAESQFVFSIDSDIKVRRDPMAEIEEKWQSRDALYIFGGVVNGWMPHSTGTSVHTIGKFLKAGGCDESMEGWGREDLKFFEGMTKIGLKLQLDGNIIEHIPHDDRMRTKHCKEKNKWASNARNGGLMLDPTVIRKRDFSIELRHPSGHSRIISPDDDIYCGKLAEKPFEY